MGTLVDTPNIWQDPDAVQEILPTEVIQEEITLPTVAEQKEIVKSCNLSNTNKSLIENLVVMHEVAEVLEKIHYTETAEQRLNYVKMLAENFVSKRMDNNRLAEELKRRLIERLLTNIDNLDLELVTRLYNDLHETTNLDAQQAVGMITGTGNTGGYTAPGLNLTINNATSEGASIVSNTLNATPQQVGQLKEVQTMNTSIKSWANSNIPLPKRKQE